MNAIFAIFAIILMIANCFAQETINATQDSVASNTKTYALLVATESFANTDIVRPDARALCYKNALALYKSLPTQDVTALCDAQSATRANILANASMIRDRAQAGDTILFLFVGLGIGGDFGEPMFLTHDFSPSAQEAANTSIRVDEMVASMHKDGVQVIMFLDASLKTEVRLVASDGLQTMMAAGPIASDVPGAYLALSYAGRVGEWPENNGLFATTLAHGLGGNADLDDNGAITPSEINRFMVTEINTQTGTPPGVRGAWKDSQNPIITLKDLRAGDAIVELAPENRESWRPTAPRAIKRASWIAGTSLLTASAVSYAMAWKAQNCLENVCFHGSDEHDKLLAQRSAWLWTSRATSVVGAIGVGAGIWLRPDGATASFTARW